MNKEQFLADEQQKQVKHKLLKKLVANARAIISNEIGLPVGSEKMSRIIMWLEPHDVFLKYPVFEEYNTAISAVASGKERLNCSREALRRYDEKLLPVSMKYNDKIIDACFEILKSFPSL